MSPQAHHGFEEDASSATLLLDATLDATLIDDPQHPRQQAMRALVEAEQAKMAAEYEADDSTRLGMLVPMRNDATALPVESLGALPSDEDPTDPPTVRNYRELPVPVVHASSPEEPSVDEPSPRSTSGSWEVEWVEMEESLPSSTPMVRAVRDESLAHAQAHAPVAMPVIRSTNPPPGPERSVVVQQVSPFGSDARVVKKTKKPIIPQGETLPFASDHAVTAPPRVESVRESRPGPTSRTEEWARNLTSAEVPGAAPDAHAKVVAVGGEINPQRYIPTQVQPLPKREEQEVVRRDLLPLTSALCAVVVAVAALVNVLI
ncbi:MAG: hypothetical protein AAFV29_04910 [Myxococcota bacterium]